MQQLPVLNISEEKTEYLFCQQQKTDENKCNISDNYIRAKQQFNQAIENVKSSNWQSQAQGLTAMRQIANTNPAILQTCITSSNFIDVMRSVLSCVDSLSSTLAKEAISTVGLFLVDFIANSAHSTKLLENIINTLIPKITSDKHFISKSVFNYLEQAAKVHNPVFLIQYLTILSRFASNINAHIVSQTSILIVTIVETLSHMNKLKASLFKTVLFPLVSRFLTEKLQSTKKSARTILNISSESLIYDVPPYSFSPLIHSLLSTSNEISFGEKIAFNKVLHQLNIEKDKHCATTFRTQSRQTKPTNMNRSATLPPARRLLRNSVAVSAHNEKENSQEIFPSRVNRRPSIIYNNFYGKCDHQNYYNPSNNFYGVDDYTEENPNLMVPTKNTFSAHLFLPQYTSQFDLSEKLQDMLHNKRASNQPNAEKQINSIQREQNLPVRQPSSIQHAFKVTKQPITLSSAFPVDRKEQYTRSSSIRSQSIRLDRLISSKQQSDTYCIPSSTEMKSFGINPIHQQNNLKSPLYKNNKASNTTSKLVQPLSRVKPCLSTRSMSSQKQ